VSRQKGFTLLETLLTVSILAVMSILAAQTISRSMKAKVKLQDQIDDLSHVRDALRLIERDLALAYHHRDFEQEILDALKKSQQTTQTPPPGSPPIYQPPAVAEKPAEAPRQDPTTQFVSSNEEMNFVTMNNSRIQANLRQADFQEVGYSLKDCRDKSSGKCLWRRTSPVVDNDVTRGGTELVLLEHVAELKFRYIGKGKQDWVTEWRSDNGGDSVTKGNYPAAVEVSLTYKKGEGDAVKEYKMQIVAPIHFPNNKEEDTSSGTNPQNATTQPPPTTGK
jgi:prepilin-type N-terminal cleavage/methylation domain-containing protein